MWLSFVIVRTRQLKRAWKRRRAQNVVLFFIELIAQMVRPWLTDALSLFQLTCFVAARNQPSQDCAKAYQIVCSIETLPHTTVEVCGVAFSCM